MTVIDSHQHVWDPSRAAYPWLDDSLGAIDRVVGFDELMPSLARAGVDATMLVEAADNDEDTDLMFETAAAHPEIVGLVVYVPLAEPARVAERLDLLCRSTLTVGVRNLIHTMPDPRWLLRDDVDDGLAVIEDLDLAFDLVAVLPEHLELIPELVRRHPRLRIVIDHLAKPPIGLAEREPWWSLIAQAAESPNVFAKLSGLYSATTDSAAWTPSLLRPFVDRALEVFGVDRLMYGGDWPISIMSGGYDRVWDGLEEATAHLDESEHAAVFGRTAERFYRLDPHHIETATAAGARP